MEGRALTTQRVFSVAGEARDEREYLPCSREQEGLWLLEQTREIGAANSLALALELRGPLDRTALRAALVALVDRHPALRTEFVERDGRLLRSEREVGAFTIPEPDVLDEPADTTALLLELSRRKLDVLRWPQLVPTLIRLGPTSHALHLVGHHCTLDGGSLNILVRDLATLYTAAATGEAAPLPALTGSYARYVRDEQRQFDAPPRDVEAYWPLMLATIRDGLRLPTGAPSAPSGRSVFVEGSVDGSLRQALLAAAHTEGTSLFVLLLAAYQTLLYRYAGGGDEGIATAVAMGTRPADMKDAVGMFANEAPLYAVPDDNLPFAEFMKQVRARLEELFRIRQFSFTEALSRFGSLGSIRDSLACISYLKADRPKPVMHPIELDVLCRLLPNGGARGPLALWLLDERSRLDFRFDFDTGVLADDMVRGIAPHFRTLLESIAANPWRALSRLELLSDAERRQILVEWNATSAGFAPATVHTLVEDQVERTPDAAAVTLGAETRTYDDLNRCANQLAHHLRRCGVGPDVPVGICVERSFELAIGALGILKAGAAYLPLDPSHPPERLRLMLENAAAPVVLTLEHLADKLPRTDAALIRLDADQSVIAHESDANPHPLARPDHLAYVIYTSGSTGAPKGVAMEHRAICNLLEWQAQAFPRREGVRTLQFASLSFDVSFQELFSTWATGGELVLVSEALRRDFDRLAGFVDHARIERMFIPFLVLNELAKRLPARQAGSDAVEVITAGEQLEITPAIRELFRRRAGWTLENQYGPTETHVVTFHPLARDADRWPAFPPIGRPIANARIRILDRAGEPCPIGVAGELHIGGAPVARGYLNRPELTAERFVADRFASDDAPLYRSGDLARWRHDGEIEFVGRIDHQVKIRGYRVEPGEIVATLLTHPQIRDAVVVLDERHQKQKRLVAYLVAATEPAPQAGEYRNFLRDRLPEYMVPSAYVTLDAIPLTANGKLDRRRLPEPTREASTQSAYVAPRTEAERRLASLWAEVLGVEEPGVNDNFFTVGGHSLLAAQLVSRIRETFERDVSLRLVFDGPTIAQMTAQLDALPERPEARQAIPRAERRELADVARGRADRR